MGTDHRLAGHVAADIYGEALAVSSTSSPVDDEGSEQVERATSALCRMVERFLCLLRIVTKRTQCRASDKLFS
jgi:hypothetical protein